MLPRNPGMIQRLPDTTLMECRNETWPADVGKYRSVALMPLRKTLTIAVRCLLFETANRLNRYNENPSQAM